MMMIIMVFSKKKGKTTTRRIPASRDWMRLKISAFIVSGESLVPPFTFRVPSLESLLLFCCWWRVSGLKSRSFRQESSKSINKSNGSRSTDPSQGMCLRKKENEGEVTMMVIPSSSLMKDRMTADPSLPGDKLHLELTVITLWFFWS